LFEFIVTFSAEVSACTDEEIFESFSSRFGKIEIYVKSWKNGQNNSFLPWKSVEKYLILPWKSVVNGLKMPWKSVILDRKCVINRKIDAFLNNFSTCIIIIARRWVSWILW